MPKQGQQILSILRSPWVLITVPLMMGGIWLIDNTWVITNNLDKPYMLAAGPATILTGLAAWAAFAFFKTIVSWCKSTGKSFTEWKKKEGSSFWLVIYVFLGVSVLESGTFFNILLGPNSLLNSLGYASAFVIDLVAVECMRARLHAVRMRDKAGSLLYLFGVIICASISAFANGYTALLHWHDPVNTPIPAAMIYVAPTIGVIFPLLMIFLSFAGDYTADQASTKLDPEEYKKSELKRIQLIEIQRDMLRSRLQIEQEIDSITQRRKAGKQGRTFFLITWLFPQNPANNQQIALAVSTELKAIYEPQIEELKHRLETLSTANITAVPNGQANDDEKPDITNAKTNDKNHLADIPTSSTQSSSSLALEDLPNDVQVVVSHYPNVYSEWLAQNIKSVTIPQIVEVTGHKRQRVSAQVGKALKRTPANENKYTVVSVIDWLKIAPLPANKEQNTEPIPANAQRIDDLITGASTPKYWSKEEENTEVTPATNGHSKDTVKLDEYAEMMGVM